MPPVGACERNWTPCCTPSPISGLPGTTKAPDYQGFRQIGETGFEPAAARPPAGTIQVNTARSGSLPCRSMRAVRLSCAQFAPRIAPPWTRGWRSTSPTRPKARSMSTYGWRLASATCGNARRGLRPGPRVWLEGGGRERSPADRERRRRRRQALAPRGRRPAHTTPRASSRRSRAARGHGLFQSSTR